MRNLISLKSLIIDENAQAAVEYVLLAAVFTLIAFVILKFTQEAWKTKFTKTRYIRAGKFGILP